MPERLNSMKKYGGRCLIAALFLCLFTGCGSAEKESNEDLYGEIIAGLRDEEQYSLQDIGEKNDVLFTTDMTYDDGNGHNVALSCKVYYSVDGEFYTLERIESLGTAWPVSYGEWCIYTASEHGVTAYAFDGKELRWKVTQYEEVFDTEGNTSCERTDVEGNKETVSEEDYLEVWEDYKESTVINFGYGASDNPF